jgi:hypothetical protein
MVNISRMNCLSAHTLDPANPRAGDTRTAGSPQDSEDDQDP